MNIALPRSCRLLACALLAGAIATPVLGQQPVPKPRGLPPGAAGGEGGSTTQAGSATADHSGRDAIIAEVDFNDTPFEDVIAFLQDAGKGYRAVIVNRNKGQDWPLITMRVKNASVEQLLDVITTAYSGIAIEPVKGPNGPIDVIRYLPDEFVAGFGGGGGGGFVGAPGGPNGPGGVMESLAGDERVVRVYRLSGIVATMVNDKRGPEGDAEKDREAGKAALAKAALANILSLIKATMETIGGREPPKLQLHEETQALIFSGTGKQQMALEDVLSALETNEAIRSSRGGSRSSAADVSRLQKQLDESRSSLEQAKQDNVLTRTELNAVQRQMELQMQDLTVRNRAYAAEIEALRASLRSQETGRGGDEKPKEN